MAAHISVQRPPWENNQIMREELSTILSNRSAAFLEAGDPISALIDAETVISIKRQWSKGHFRKAKALLAMQEYREARDAINLGLQFEPKNAVGQNNCSAYSVLTI
jgi:translocation protein SEC72